MGQILLFALPMFCNKMQDKYLAKKIMQGANHTCFFWTNNFLCFGPPSNTWGNFESERCWRRVAKFSFCKQTIENNGLFRIFHGVHCNHTFLSKWDLGWKGLAEHVFLEGENGRPNIIQNECNCPKMTCFFCEKTCQKWKIWVAARLDRKDSAASANLIPQSTKSTHRFCSLTTSRSCRIKNLATRGRLSCMWKLCPLFDCFRGQTKTWKMVWSLTNPRHISWDMAQWLLSSAQWYGTKILRRSTTFWWQSHPVKVNKKHFGTFQLRYHLLFWQLFFCCDRVMFVCEMMNLMNWTHHTWGLDQAPRPSPRHCPRSPLLRAMDVPRPCACE